MKEKYQIAGLLPRHYRIIDLSIRGMSVGKIAEELKMSRTQVSVVVNSPTFKHEFAMRRSMMEEMMDKDIVEGDDEVTKTLKDGAKAAAEKLVSHVGSSEESISVKSCAEVLDRTGYGKVVKDAGAAGGLTLIINEKEAHRIADSINLDNDNSTKPAGQTKKSSGLPPTNS